MQNSKRGGLADRLQKLLIRQASSINFVKHHMNKKGISDEQAARCNLLIDKFCCVFLNWLVFYYWTHFGKVKNVANIVRVMPLFKQSSLGMHNFCLIHALQFDGSEADEWTKETTASDDEIHELMDRVSSSSQYVYLLVSQEKADSLHLSKYFDHQKNSFVRTKILLKIYPPW